MSRIEIETFIHAPQARCFDLARDIDVHLGSMSDSGERAIAGRASGKISLGEEVTFEARHFGLLHRHTSKITRFEPPQYFRDEMIEGRFRSFVHDHFFEHVDDGTLMKDVLEYAVPFGIAGRLFDQLVLRSYLKEVIRKRNDLLKSLAEDGA